MNDTPHRLDLWVQWALLVLTIVGALWNLSGRLARIEQQLHDDATFHVEETGRIENLEREMAEHAGTRPYKSVVH